MDAVTKRRVGAETGQAWVVMQPWVPGHKHQPESQLSLAPSPAHNGELTGQQTCEKAPLRGTRAQRLLQGSETQLLQSQWKEEGWS